MVGVSVVICCYNSRSRIDETLRYLANQELLDGSDIEIIIVDNNCSDDTVDVATQLWKGLSNPFELKVVTQNIPGLSHARAKGMEASKYNYILFCDDDNWLCPKYIQTVLNIFESNPEVGIIGGLGVEKLEEEPPIWFQNIKGCYALGPQNDANGIIPDERGFVFGAGMCFRLSVWKKIEKEFGNKFFLSDRKGAKLTSGGDSEFCYKAILLNYKIYYSSDLLFYHYMPKSRINWKYFVSLQVSFARSNPFLDLLKEFKKDNFDFWQYYKTTLVIFYYNYRKHFKKFLILMFKSNLIEGDFNALHLRYQLIYHTNLILNYYKYYKTYKVIIAKIK